MWLLWGPSMKGPHSLCSWVVLSCAILPPLEGLYCYQKVSVEISRNTMGRAERVKPQALLFWVATKCTITLNPQHCYFLLCLIVS